MTPIPVTDLDVAFPANVHHLMPPYDAIPEEFRRSRSTKWNEIFSDWFYDGLPKGTELRTKAGIDPKAAMRHIRCIMASFQPKHEHKEAAVSYLLSLWYDDIVIPNAK